jgi:hypothetical protein
MSQDNPSIPELLRTVREFIEEVTPKLAGQDRYHALCTSYLVSIVEREVELGEAIDRAELAALRAFTGRSQPLAEGYADLAREIRAGTHDARWDALAMLLFEHVVNKVRVSKPDHLHPMHRN